MDVLKIKTIADPILYEKSQPVTEFNAKLRDLARKMFVTMYDQDGVGLAAVQVGVLKRMLVIDLEKMGFVKGVFINPEVVSTSKETQTDEEGCLSVPGLVAPLTRPLQVTVKYKNIFGEEEEISCEKLMARAMLHEMDHLDGKVFVDLLEPQHRKPLENDIGLIKSGKPGEHSDTPEYRKKR